MKKQLYQYSALLLCGLLILVMLCGLTWYAQRQERLRKSLFAAIRNNDTSQVKSLLRQGANANASLPHRFSVWTRVQALGPKEFLHASLHPQSALLYALKRWESDVPTYPKENPDMIEALLRAGADVNSTDSDGRTALHYAARINKEATARLLLKYQARPDVADVRQETPLIVAATDGSASFLALLLQHQADVLHKDKEGHDALYYARQMRDFNSVRLLRQAGAKE